MEAGVGRVFDQLSTQATQGMGDLSLLSVIAMSPDMSAAASTCLSSHRFSAPQTPPHSKQLRPEHDSPSVCSINHNSPPIYSISQESPLVYSISHNLPPVCSIIPNSPPVYSISHNSPPVYSISGQQANSNLQSPLYNQVEVSASDAQRSDNPFTARPTSSSSATANPQFRPARPARTPNHNNSNHNHSSQDNSNLQNILHSSQNSSSHIRYDSRLESSMLHRVHSSVSPAQQQVARSMASGHHSIPSQNQDFSYKLSKTPSFNAAHMSCNSPLLVSPVSRSIMPLAAQDLNLVHLPTSLHAMPSGHNLISSQSNLGTVQEMSVHHSFAQTIEPERTSMNSAPSPSHSNHSNHSSHSQPSPDTDGSHMRTHSTSSTANECPSPQVSDLGSEDTNVSVSQQSFAQSYTSLTPWTTKLTSPGYIPLPHPSPEAMPIPLENISKEYMLTISPSTLDVPTHQQHSRVYQAYSRLQPGMGGGYSNPPYAKTVKNGLVGGNQHAQKAQFKILPNKEHRFKRTVDALQKSGLWEVAMKTGNLIKRNQELQKELEQFRSDALTFLKSVIKNPQNRDFIKNVLNNALASNSTPRNGSSVMTVVVSAAAAAATASVRLDSNGSTDGSTSGSTST